MSECFWSDAINCIDKDMVDQHIDKKISISPEKKVCLSVNKNPGGTFFSAQQGAFSDLEHEGGNKFRRCPTGNIEP